MARIPSSPGTGKVIKTNSLVIRSPYPKINDEFQKVSKLGNPTPQTSLTKVVQTDQATVLHASKEDKKEQSKTNLVGTGELELSKEEQEAKKTKIRKMMHNSAIEARTTKILAPKKRSAIQSPDKPSNSLNFTFKKKKQ